MIAPASDMTGGIAAETAMPDRRDVLRLERSTLFAAIAPLIVDLGSTLAFYAFFAVTADARLAAAAGMAIAVGQLAYATIRRRRIAILQWASIGVVLVVGTLTLLTGDPRFVLVKVTLVYAIIGGSMLRRGWMARYVPPIAAEHLPENLLGGFEKAWAILLLGTGALNLTLVLAANPARTPQIMAVWVVASKLGLFGIQYVWCRAVARPRIKAEIERST